MPACQSVLLAAPILFLGASVAGAHMCQCRNRGVMYELGQTSCLHVDGRNYLARCEMKLNVSSWTEVEDGCPVSDAGAFHGEMKGSARQAPLIH
jgi:hypothetical protein